MHYSGFWRRFFAFLVDTVITVAAGMALGLMLGVVMAVTAPFDRLGVAEALANLSGFLLGWLYFAGMESSATQATLGKQLLGMRVTDLDGNPIGFGRASGRYFAKILSSLMLLTGYLMAAFTAKKQGLHDILAGCVVVNGRAR